jgi:hypothetical protein
MKSIKTAIKDLRTIIRGGNIAFFISLYISILCIGIFARVWDFGKLPSGLIADEASISVDAFSLLHYGLDHNGVSYPIHFVSFGSGQNALYGYLLVPFIAVLGLKTIAVKLPMLISGVLTLPLIYWVTSRTFDKRTALIAMFFLAISPWHIMLSRIGLESNLLPFVFLLGYACLLKSFENPNWFIAACGLLAVCLYSYVTAYLTIPLFLACVVVIFIRGNTVSFKQLAAGLASFLVISVPIGLFVLVNLAGLNSIKIGLITIPHLPTQPRFESQAGTLTHQFLPTLGVNTWGLIKLLVKQYDGIIYNTIEPYGYFYGITFPLVIIGAILLLQSQQKSSSSKILLLLAWLGTPLVFGIIQPVNINRINLIFIPLLICMAAALVWLGEKLEPLLPIAVCSLLLAFIAFTIDYHGDAYGRMADIKFHTGLLSAIQYASTTTQGPICVTDKIDMPYIYVLFVEKPDPASYLNSIQYVDNGSPFRQVRSLLRYTFGKQNCINLPDTVYLLRSDDGFPKTGSKYNVEVFNDFHVYTPKP